MNENPSVVVPHTNMRKTIARRLSESKRTIPHFYASIELDVTGITSHRLRFRQSGVATPSLNDYLLFATSRALVEESAVNSLWGEDGITKCKHLNKGIATTTRRISEERRAGKE